MLQNKLKVIRGNWNVFRKLDKLFKLNFFYLQFQNSYKRKGDKDVKKKKREREGFQQEEVCREVINSKVRVDRLV